MTSTRNSGNIILQNTDFNISQEVLTHSNLGEFTAYNNPKKPEKGGGKFAKGGHGEANIQELKKRGIAFIIKTPYYDNGVRVGCVPTHKEISKRTGIGQAWFPEDWDENKIREAGKYVLKHKEAIIPIKNPITNEVVGYNIFAKYDDVTVGVFTDKEGKLSGKNGTIFPDNKQREIDDIKNGNE